MTHTVILVVGDPGTVSSSDVHSRAVTSSVQLPPLIVVTNDDGIHAEGLSRLAASLTALGEVYVVAPETDQSAASHAITLGRPLRLREISPQRYALDGTPADCIYVAIHHADLLPRKPSLVASGINHGLNLGTDVFYSGTVAGAREGALRGVSAMAFSMAPDADVRAVARRAQTLAARMLLWRDAHPDAPPALLNVNFPAGSLRGARATRLGKRIYDDAVDLRLDPRGRSYLWLGGHGVHHPEVSGSDTEAYSQGYVSVTPLRMEITEASQASLAGYVALGRRDPAGQPR